MPIQGDGPAPHGAVQNQLEEQQGLALYLRAAGADPPVRTTEAQGHRAQRTARFCLIAPLTAVANTTQSLEQEHQNPYFQGDSRSGGWLSLIPQNSCQKLG